MDIQTLGLTVSLVINVMQYISSWHKQSQTFKIDQSRLELEQQRHNDAIADKKAERAFQLNEKKRDYQFRLNSQSASHKHELDKLKLDESIEIHRSLVPQLQRIFSKYVAITNKEIIESSTFPIKFSPEQLKQEEIVSLYCPNAINQISSMKSLNSNGSSREYLLEALNNNVVPELATYLLKLPNQGKN